MKLEWYDHVIQVFKLIGFLATYYYDDFSYKIRGDRTPLKKEEEEDVNGEVVVITGANRGIGKQIALEFAQKGAIVVFGCRNVKSAAEAIEEIKEKTGNEKLDVFPIDLMDMDSVEKFAKDVAAKYPKIKLLINNAGLAEVSCNDPKKLTKDFFNPIMAANHFGHFLLTNLLLKNLQNSTKPRVIVLTSILQKANLLDLKDLTMQESGFGFIDGLPYVNSKFANSLFAKELGKRMEREGSDLTVYSVCPGLVYTGLIKQTNKFADLSFKFCCKCVGMGCEQAVSEFVMHVALSKKLGHRESGLMYQFRKPCQRMNPILQDADEFGEKLWDISAKLVKLEERLKSK